MVYYMEAMRNEADKQCAPMVSVIVPVYKVEAYLPACIDSILGQTFRDFELLLVDDGSPDRCGEICDEYARRDGRVRVFHQSNAGVSAARNVGLEHARGEWVAFVDSDDTYLPDALPFMIGLTNERIDFVEAGYVVYYESGEIFSAEREPICQSMDKVGLLELMYDKERFGYQGYVWNKLLRRSVIERAGLHFARDLKFNEDRLFGVQFLCAMEGVGVFSTTPVYRYVLRTEGAMQGLKRAFNPSYFTDLLAFERMFRCIEPLGNARLLKMGKDGIYSSAYLIRMMARRFKIENQREVKKQVFEVCFRCLPLHEIVLQEAHHLYRRIKKRVRITLGIEKEAKKR